MTSPAFPGPGPLDARTPETAADAATAAAASAPLSGDSRELVFDDLVAEITQPVVTKEVCWSMPHRPGWMVRYRLIEDYDEIERSTKAADRARRKPTRRPGEVDINGLVASGILLATHCTGILRNGREWLEDNMPVTFSHPKFIEVMSRASESQNKGPIRSARDAAIMAYGWDADVINHGNRLQIESGWGDTGEDDDPTVAV